MLTIQLEYRKCNFEKKNFEDEFSGLFLLIGVCDKSAGEH